MTVFLCALLALPMTARAQTAVPRPEVIGVMSAEQDEKEPEQSHIMLRLDSAADSRFASLQPDTVNDTVTDMNFFIERANRYLANGKSLLSSNGALKTQAAQVSVPQRWLLGEMPKEKEIVSADANVALAVFSRAGKLKRAVFTHDRDVLFADTRLKVSQGKMTDCDAQRSGCDTEVYFLLNNEHFTLLPGHAHQPRDPRIASVYLLHSEREQKPSENPWQNLEYAVVYDADFSPKNAKGPFIDVEYSHPYREAIEFVKDESVVKGYDDGNFKPERTVNRAEFSKMLLETLDDSSFKDACFSYPGDLKLFSDTVYASWYGPYVCMAKYRNLISGYPDGTFKPEQSISFAEAAKIVSIGYALPLREQGIEEEWHVRFRQALESAGAVPPSITKPEQHITRGEFAHMLFVLETRKEAE